ncbi:MAG TPA: hypothetical protein VNC61_15565 [Acidimicrobiales bacterium]|nr:hypothetical protein [Acidimicrobiales bacterium]
MPSGLILTFADGVTEGTYNAVNATLGIDMAAGTGDFPDGLIRHTAGPTPTGGWIVTEVWESEDHQGRFMESRLGEALATNGLPAPSSVVWYSVARDTTP